MDFVGDLNSIDPRFKRMSFNILEEPLPSKEDHILASKEYEVCERYSDARTALLSARHAENVYIFPPQDNEKTQLFIDELTRRYLYEYALLAYSSVADLSWSLCWAVMTAKRSEAIDPFCSVDELYMFVRNEEGARIASGHFNRYKDDYPEFIKAINLVEAFWNKFKSTAIRENCNYIKHRGMPFYEEENKYQLSGSPIALHVNGVKQVSGSRDLRVHINVNEQIKALYQFDNEMLYPYIKRLFQTLEDVVMPSKYAIP